QAGAVRLCRRGGDRRRHAGGLFRHPALHQPGAKMVAQTRRELSALPAAAAPSAAARVRLATTESDPVRWVLIALGLGFILLVIALPLVRVFREALRGGIGAFLRPVTEHDTPSAIRLALLVAATAVPLNLIF